MNDYAFGGGTASEEAATVTRANDVPANEGLTLFDKFREEMNHPPVLETTKTFLVAGRPRISVEFSTLLDYEILDRYIARNTRKNKINVLNLSYDILTLLNRGFRLDGEVVEHEGSPLTFVHPMFLQFMKAGSAREAILSLYGADAQIVATGQALLDACGFTDVVQEDDDAADPTRRN